jgi:outer membrane biosynthesis protein TonB
MKTRIFAIMAGVLMLSFTSVQASNADEKKVTGISNYIENTVSYPVFAKVEGIKGTVNVLVKFDEKGDLQISQIWGSNKRLVSHVERQIKKLSKKEGTFKDFKNEKKLVRIKFNLAS